jgi:Ca2+-binding EF-hand superfamily protein
MCDEKTLREIFTHFDTDKSGSIDSKELKAVLKAYFEAVQEPHDDKRVDEVSAAILKELDTDKSGSISVDEFIKAFK